jgi:uncharacterized protein GlcG (DUF336 family)
MKAHPTQRSFAPISRIAAYVAAIALPFLASPLRSEDLVTVSHISLELAQKAAAASLRQCQTDGHRVSATITDAAGVTLLTARADGAGPHTVESSRRKAYTAASLRQPTQVLAEIAAGSAELEGLRDMNDSILLLGGGFPIKLNGVIVGAIGIGGAPGVRLDEACARAGLAAIGADLFGRAK